MSLDPRAVFLARIQADSGLQRLLRDPDSVTVAVSIARAAGFTVTAADLCGAAVPAHQPSGPTAGFATRDPLASQAQEGDVIDFDGDGIPDAVRHGNRWELTSQEEG